MLVRELETQRASSCRAIAGACYGATALVIIICAARSPSVRLNLTQATRKRWSGIISEGGSIDPRGLGTQLSCAASPNQDSYKLVRICRA
jgi:hypothetical protein